MEPTRHQAERLLQSRQPATTPWLAVTGGKGGVGKTVIAVNLALSMARSGHRTLLVDLDPGLANVDVHLRLAPEFTVEDLAAGRCTVDEALVDGPGGIAVLAGRSGSLELAGGSTEAVQRVLMAVGAAARGFDVVVCDTGAGIGPAVVETAARADLVLAVTTPDPASVTDTYALCKVLRGRGTALPGLVLNRVADRDQALRSAGKLGIVCERFLGGRPETVGWLQADGDVERSVVEQQPYFLEGNGAVAEDLRALAAGALSRLPVPARRGRTPEVRLLARGRPHARSGAPA